MKSNLSVKRTFIPFGYASEYAASWELQALQLPILVEVLLTNLFEARFFAKATVEDLKGRDPELLIENSVSSHPKPHGFELVYISGNRFTIMGDEPQTAIVQADNNFSLSILTPFESFEGSRHIRHKIEIQRSGLPEWMSPHEVARAFPLELHIFRIGIDLFEPKFGSILGITPTVTETLLLESDQQQCQIKIIANHKDRDCLPLGRDGLLDKTDSALKGLFSFSLKQDYLSKLKS